MMFPMFESELGPLSEEEVKASRKSLHTLYTLLYTGEGLQEVRQVPLRVFSQGAS